MHLSSFISAFTVTNSQRSVHIFIPSVQAILAFLSNTNIKENKDIAVHFVGKQKITHLHAQYFKDPTPTDCITFPYNDPNFLGEIFICPKTALEYVEKYGGSLEREMTLYLIHGYLHLQGFEDKTLKGKKQMRQQEKKWMQILDKKGLRIQIQNAIHIPIQELVF